MPVPAIEGHLGFMGGREFVEGQSIGGIYFTSDIYIRCRDKRDKDQASARFSGSVKVFSFRTPHLLGRKRQTVGLLLHLPLRVRIPRLQGP